MHDALKRCGLSRLTSQLDDEAPGFCRLLIDPPDVVIMDETTSALDEFSEAMMMEFLCADLAAITAIGVARSGLEQYFDREITFRCGEDLAHATV